MYHTEMYHMINDIPLIICVRSICEVWYYRSILTDSNMVWILCDIKLFITKIVFTFHLIRFKQILVTSVSCTCIYLDIITNKWFKFTHSMCFCMFYITHCHVNIKLYASRIWCSFFWRKTGNCLLVAVLLDRC